MGRWVSAICVVVLMVVAAHAEPKIDELDIGPADKVIGLAISPSNLHVAAVMNKGSRFVVAVDGAEGPKLDQVLSLDGSAYSGASTVPVLFSDDGSHWAYLAKVGNDLVVFADGKELLKVPFKPSGVHAGLRYSPGGKHLTFTLGAEGGGSITYMDGQPGPKNYAANPVVFSPDGAHYAYTGMEADGKGKWAVVDGRQVKYIGEKLWYTTNGHLVSLADGKNGQAMLIDGKPVLVAPSINPIWISPTGVMIAAHITQKPGGPYALMMDGKPVAAADGLMTDQVVFSPDGKRYAAICRSPAGGKCVIVDGKKEQEYTDIQKLRFSPDSSRYAYQAVTNKSFVVIDGEESDGYAMIEDILMAGKHVAFSATLPNYVNREIVIDGKAARRKTADRLVLSDDGARHAYAGDGTAVSNNALYLDGAEQPGITLLPFTAIMRDPDPVPGENRQITKVGVGIRSVIFSPDGKHYAYVGSVPNVQGKMGLWLDGKLVGPTKMPSMAWAMFTPDSKHLIWVNDNELFIDGKSIVKYQGTNYDSQCGNWTIQSDGTFGAITKVGDSYKRLRITMGDDTTIDTLLAGAK